MLFTFCELRTTGCKSECLPAIVLTEKSKMYLKTLLKMVVVKYETKTVSKTKNLQHPSLLQNVFLREIHTKY